MKLVKSTLVVAGLVASIVMLGGCGSYRHGPEGQTRHVERMSERLARDLDLNETQRARLDALRGTLMGVVQDMRDDREATRDTVLDLLSQPTFDRARALSLVQEKTQRVNAKAPEVVEAFGAFYDSLDTDQQAQLRERIEKRSERHGYCRK